MKYVKCGQCNLRILGNEYKVNPLAGELYTEKVYICNNERCKNFYKEEDTDYSKYY